MKKLTLKMLVAAGVIAATVLAPADTYAQRTLPDGTVIYDDGSRRLPNGTTVDRNGNVINQRRNDPVVLPDGTIVYPDRNKRDRTRTDRNNRRHNNPHGLPPGQAKKVYGGSAKDYAPGQQKKRNNDDRRWGNDDRRWNDDGQKRNKKAKKNKGRKD